MANQLVYTFRRSSFNVDNKAMIRHNLTWTINICVCILRQLSSYDKSIYRRLKGGGLLANPLITQILILNHICFLPCVKIASWRGGWDNPITQNLTLSTFSFLPHVKNPSGKWLTLTTPWERDKGMSHMTHNLIIKTCVFYPR